MHVPDRPLGEREIFEAALQVGAEERLARVRRACGEDRELERRVLRLLAAHARAQGTPESVTTGSLAGTDPERVGRYRVLERLGQGGMGVVYLAEQTEPIRRKVALKVIRAGMSTEEVVARFHAERQVLALMDHPGIARIFDSGATEQGLPYFVMEHVPGEPLLAYCDQRRLSLEARLGLFVRVCRAVQHAHGKGIIHRDLKPSNVLVVEVDGRPVPKVIDFGIAKAADPSQEDDAGLTRTGHLIGTPAYMSPEQVRGSVLDVDTRSDVYSLGVVLYELATGTPPFELRALAESSLAEMQRILLEVDPPRPSARVASLGERGAALAESRGLSSSRLVAQLRGDLDRVVMKALDKERARRYETAEGFARDVERYLANEPVAATSPSRAYLVRKFVTRHRGLVAAASVVVLALLLGTIGTGVGLLRASRQRVLAEDRARDAAAAAARAVAVRDFLTGMLASANPRRSLRKDVRVSEILTEAVESLDAGAFGSDPDTELTIRATLGEALKSVDRLEDAQRQLRLAVELLPRARSIDALGGPGLRLDLGEVLSDRGRYAEAGELARAALDELDARGVGDDELRVKALFLLAHVRYNEGSTDEALELSRAGLAVRERLEGFGGEHTAHLWTIHAFYLVRKGELEQALEEIERSLPILLRGSPRARLDAAFALRQRATVFAKRGRLAEAHDDLDEALRMRETLYDVHSIAQSDLLHDLAGLELKMGAVDAAEEHARRALEVRRELCGDHRDTATALTTCGAVARARRDYALAIAHNEEALAMRRRLYPEDSPVFGDSLWRLGEIRREMGDLVAAEGLLRQADENWRRSLGEDHPDAVDVRFQLAKTLRLLERWDEAEELLDGVMACHVARYGTYAQKTNEARDQLIGLRLDTEDYAGAEELLREALALSRAARPEGNRLQTYLGAQLGAAQLGQGLHEEAEALLLASWEALGEDPAIWAENKLFILDQLVRLYAELEDEERAGQYRDEAAALRGGAR